jgi:hypothetical protein
MRWVIKSILLGLIPIAGLMLILAFISGVWGPALTTIGWVILLTPLLAIFAFMIGVTIQEEVGLPGRPTWQEGDNDPFKKE